MGKEAGPKVACITGHPFKTTVAVSSVPSAHVAVSGHLINAVNGLQGVICHGLKKTSATAKMNHALHLSVSAH